MAETTPTGILIAPCATCGHRHPVTRKHCPMCGLAHLFPCTTPTPTERESTEEGGMTCSCGNMAPTGTEGWRRTDADWCPKCAWLA